MERTDVDGPRLVGVDIARGFAIIGMLWVHFAPDGTGSAFPDGRSAILLATLAGVSLGLLIGGSRRPTLRARLAGYRTVALRGAAPASRVAIADVMFETVVQGTALVIATHDPVLAERCDRVIRLTPAGSEDAPRMRRSSETP